MKLYTKSKIVYLSSVDNPVYFLPVVFNVRKPDWLIFLWLFVARVPIYTIVVIWNTKDTTLFLEVSVRFHIFCVLFFCISPYWHENHTNTTSRSGAFIWRHQCLWTCFVDISSAQNCAVSKEHTRPDWLSRLTMHWTRKKKLFVGERRRKAFLLLSAYPLSHDCLWIHPKVCEFLYIFSLFIISLGRLSLKATNFVRSR